MNRPDPYAHWRQVAAQAAVSRQDLTLSMALLSLWSSVGGSISSSIAALLWAEWVPRDLRTYMPASVNDTHVAEFYADITLLRAYNYDDPVRQGAIEAYQHILWRLSVMALILSFASLIVACLQADYSLDERRDVVAVTGEDGKALSVRQANGDGHTRDVTSHPQRAARFMLSA